MWAAVQSLWPSKKMGGGGLLKHSATVHCKKARDDTLVANPINVPLSSQVVSNSPEGAGNMVELFRLYKPFVMCFTQQDALVKWKKVLWWGTCGTNYWWNVHLCNYCKHNDKSSYLDVHTCIPGDIACAGLLQWEWIVLWAKNPLQPKLVTADNLWLLFILTIIFCTFSWWRLVELFPVLLVALLLLAISYSPQLKQPSFPTGIIKI